MSKIDDCIPDGKDFQNWVMRTHLKVFPELRGDVRVKYVLGDYEFQCSKCIPCFESGKECCRGCGLDFAVYNQPEPVRTPIILYHKGKPQRAVLVE